MCASITSNDFKTGMTIEFDGAPYRVVGEWQPGLLFSCAAWRQQPLAPPACPLALPQHTITLARLTPHLHPLPISPSTPSPSSPVCLPPTEFLHVKPGKGAAFVRSKLKNYITGNTVDRTWRAGESVELANVEKKDTQFTYEDGEEVRRQACLPFLFFSLPIRGYIEAGQQLTCEDGDEVRPLGCVLACLHPCSISLELLLTSVTPYCSRARTGARGGIDCSCLLAT